MQRLRHAFQTAFPHRESSYSLPIVVLEHTAKPDAVHVSTTRIGRGLAISGKAIAGSLMWPLIVIVLDTLLDHLIAASMDNWTSVGRSAATSCGSGGSPRPMSGKTDEWTVMPWHQVH